MLSSRTLALALLCAMSLGFALPSLASSGASDIRIELLDPIQSAIGAREPAILLPGPKVYWSSDSGSEHVALTQTGWERQAQTDELPWWSKGVLSADLPIPQGAQSWSAASLRNGTLRGVDGEITGWSPDVAIDSEGHRHLVFDRFHGSDYDIVFRDGETGEESVLASSLAFEAHASITIDAASRLWVAWDEGGNFWGRGAGLHETRRLRLIMRDSKGWHEVALPSSEHLLLENGQQPSPFPGMPELPRLVAEADGPLWLFYRVLQPHTDPTARTASRRVAWVIRAVALTDSGWSTPQTLPQSDGPNHDTLAVLAAPQGGVFAAWTGDGRLDRFSSANVWRESLMVESQLQTAHLSFIGSDRNLGTTVPGRSTWKTVNASTLSKSSPLITGDPDPTLGPEGYIRLWGDLHRHSDLSRCAMDNDGSVPDQYRYAAGPGRLDFVAVTDHHQHLSLSAWEFLLDTTDRFLDTPNLLTMFGFEYAFNDGHRNLICADRSVAGDIPLLSDASAELSLFGAQDFVAIPHQITEENSILDWKDFAPDLETQVEVYQRRGSYEEHGGMRVSRRAKRRGSFVVDYLKEGKRFGFIASSDHRYTNGAFAVVYAGSRDRESLLEGLRERRSYAATARIALDVRLGELMMGEEGPVDSAAPLTVEVAAGSEIARVDLIRNGEMVHSWDGSSLEQPASDGLIFLRYGELEGRPDLLLQGSGIEFGAAKLFDGEPETASRESEGWSASRFLQYASRRAQFIGGWVVPVRFTGNAKDAKITFGEGAHALSWSSQELLSGSEWKKKYQGKPVSLRLSPPALKDSRFEGEYQPRDWKKGDWVYVRVVRADAAMAWSSPIWVD
ncbi:MAG: hypothetical protein GY902_03230 [Planctomycetes bacterium]|nr:hypothetical protein [Planctomycetota bacterium]